jgi:hypothetical protein
MAASALGALAAGFWGVRIGLKKLRTERAFEKQVAWYHELCETIQMLKHRHAGLRLFLEKPNAYGKIPELLEDITRHAFRFQELALQANLYATPETHGRVMATVEAMNALSTDLLAPQETASGRRRAATDASMKMLDILFVCLARDARKLLGLKGIEAHEGLIDALVSAEKADKESQAAPSTGRPSAENP